MWPIDLIDKVHDTILTHFEQHQDQKHVYGQHDTSYQTPSTRKNPTGDQLEDKAEVWWNLEKLKPRVLSHREDYVHTNISEEASAARKR